MSKQQGLLIGTLIFVFLGVVAAFVFYIYVGIRSPAPTKSANRTYPFRYLVWLWFRC